MKFVSIVTLALLLLAGPLAQAAEPSAQKGCLNRDQRRAALASRQALPLAEVMRAVRVRRADVIDAKLCYRPNASGQNMLVYLLTVLARDGKVTRVVVDASSGKLAGAR